MVTLGARNSSVVEFREDNSQSPVLGFTSLSQSPGITASSLIHGQGCSAAQRGHSCTVLMSDAPAERICLIDGHRAAPLFCNRIVTCAGRKWLFKAAHPFVLVSVSESCSHLVWMRARQSDL